MKAVPLAYSLGFAILLVCVLCFIQNSTFDQVYSRRSNCSLRMKNLLNSNHELLEIQLYQFKDMVPIRQK